VAAGARRCIFGGLDTPNCPHTASRERHAQRHAAYRGQRRAMIRLACSRRPLGLKQGHAFPGARRTGCRVGITLRRRAARAGPVVTCGAGVAGVAVAGRDRFARDRSTDESARVLFAVCSLQPARSRGASPGVITRPLQPSRERHGGVTASVTWLARAAAASRDRLRQRHALTAATTCHHRPRRIAAASGHHLGRGHGASQRGVRQASRERHLERHVRVTAASRGGEEPMRRHVSVTSAWRGAGR
jgi:hypothetical protein